MIFLEPQFRNDHGEILNVVNMKGKAVGYLSYMYKDQGDLYVLGQLEDEGEKQNFLDLTTHFVNGLKQSVIGDEEAEPYVYIHMGGETMNLAKDQKEKESQSEE